MGDMSLDTLIAFYVKKEPNNDKKCLRVRAIWLLGDSVKRDSCRVISLFLLTLHKPWNTSKISWSYTCTHAKKRFLSFVFILFSIYTEMILCVKWQNISVNKQNYNKN